MLPDKTSHIHPCQLGPQGAALATGWMEETKSCDAAGPTDLYLAAASHKVWALNYETAWLLLSEARKHIHTARNPSSTTDFLLLGCWRFRPAVGHALQETFEYFIRNPSQEIKHVRCVKYVFQTADDGEQYSRACTENKVVQTLTDRYNFSFTMVSITKAIFGRHGGYSPAALNLWANLSHSAFSWRRQRWPWPFVCLCICVCVCLCARRAWFVSIQDILSPTASTLSIVKRQRHRLCWDSAALRKQTIAKVMFDYFFFN